MARKATTPPVLPDLGLEDAYASLLMIEPRRASEIHPVLVEALAKRFSAHTEPEPFTAIVDLVKLLTTLRS